MIEYREWNLEELAQWPWLAQLRVLALILLLLQIIGYWWYLKPELGQLEQLKQQELGIKQSIQIKTSQLANSSQVLFQRDSLSRRYQQLSLPLSPAPELAMLLASVNEQGLKHNLTFSRIDWGQQETQNHVHRLPLNIELSGRFHDIGAFTQAIASLSPMINLVDVRWQRINPASQILHFQARAFTYQLPSKETYDD
ncbi:type IV pilus assembly protein PilO [Vibrio ichthyoenteri ATCC 700023]|uniref:Type IV pilus assembly protein PilO n=1 Tax=Vibrio ichthyoenteri ATCC 700023 TaxID=870968 RepID=F9S8J5_9VIBR|nr:type 4a pilus biogenesis protein PilO [Vibrio ichthyoenteri]EGU29671.1 type IV pilus assembly protein PilO [Vibrio ichthyoenteri ATCC 700023]